MIYRIYVEIEAVDEPDDHYPNWSQARKIGQFTDKKQAMEFYMAVKKPLMEQ
jgi:hypothetical protein